LKEGLQNALAAENGQSHWPVKIVAGRDGGARGVLVATEEIAEGGEILVEEPFLAAPWSAQDLVQKVYCVHCLRRLAQPDVDGSAPVVAEARSGYCSSVCEAAACLHKLSLPVGNAHLWEDGGSLRCAGVIRVRMA
jgi:hypothetical protein